ncbi:ribosomal RNA processing protein 1 homolog A-like [Ptychodera flava]|uniref:ribosomal RNA processing protein 1 homolog A-like n=1 Tax=Ptychodera flava TaxID=63121 RepID=UPI003969BCA8
MAVQSTSKPNNAVSHEICSLPLFCAVRSQRKEMERCCKLRMCTKSGGHVRFFKSFNMANSEQASYSAEVHFAQRLAANEKKVRDRAVKNLRKWVSVRSQSDENAFSETDLLKIWKGLFYCMWMSDKPVIQEELAETIANLIHSFQTTSSALNFVETFFQTMAREWLGIDRLRLDKFYMLVRRCLSHSFEMVKRRDWDSEVIDELMNVMKNGVLNPHLDNIPDGLRFHVTDIFLGELTKVGGQNLSPEETCKFVEPFCELAAKTKKSVVLQNVVNEIFKNGIIFTSDVGLEDDEEMEAAEPDEEKTHEDGDLKEGETQEENAKDENVTKKMKLIFDYQAISECLYACASDPKVLSKTRAKLYVVVKKLKDLAEGIFPIESIDNKVLEVLDEEEKQQQAKMKLQKRKKRIKWRQNKKNKKRKIAEENQSVQDSVLQEFSPKSKNTKSSDSTEVNSVENINNTNTSYQGIEDKMEDISNKTSEKKTAKRKKKERDATDTDMEKRKSGKFQSLESVTISSSSDSVNTEKGSTKTMSNETRESDKIATPINEKVKESTSDGKAVDVEPFMRFKKVREPVSFIRKAYSKMGKKATEKMECDNSTKSKKKVEFALSMTTSQDPKDYKEQVKKSPLVPFDEKKKPSHSALKSPEQPVVLRRSTRKRKHLGQ